MGVALFSEQRSLPPKYDILYGCISRVLLRIGNGDETHVVAAEVVDGSLGEHSIV